MQINVSNRPVQLDKHSWEMPKVHSNGNDHFWVWDKFQDVQRRFIFGASYELIRINHPPYGGVILMVVCKTKIELVSKGRTISRYLPQHFLTSCPESISMCFSEIDSNPVVVIVSRRSRGLICSLSLRVRVPFDFVFFSSSSSINQTLVPISENCWTTTMSWRMKILMEDGKERRTFLHLVWRRSKRKMEITQSRSVFGIFTPPKRPQTTLSSSEDLQGVRRHQDDRKRVVHLDKDSCNVMKIRTRLNCLTR